MSLVAWGIALCFFLTLTVAYTDIVLAFVEARRKNRDAAMRNILLGLLLCALTAAISAPMLVGAVGAPGIIGGIALFLAAIGLATSAFVSDFFERLRYADILDVIQRRQGEQADDEDGGAPPGCAA